MKLYLTGPPVSTRKNLWTPITTELRVESERLALISRANYLHQQSPTGLSIKAAGLKVRGTISHLRRARGEHYCLLYWITLSDGSKHRAAWKRQNAEGRLTEAWDRVPWQSLVFALRGRQRATQRARKDA